MKLVSNPCASRFGCVVLAFSFACGCASAADKKRDEKMAKEVQLKDRADLSFESNQIVSSAVGLKASQKSSLFALHDSTKKKLDDLQADSIKLRTILVEKLLSPSYDPDEVDLIRDRMTRVEKKKLATIFAAADQVNTILGHDGIQSRRQMIRNFIYIDTP